MRKYLYPQEFPDMKSLKDFKEFPFYIGATTKPVTSFPMHTHSFSELVVILNGVGTHIVDNKDYSITTGDVYVLNKNISHGFKDGKNLILCNIMYSPDWFFKFEHDLKKLAGYHSLFVIEPYYRKKFQFNGKLHLNSTMLNYVNDIINKLTNELKLKKDGYKSVIYGYFILLVTYLSRLYSDIKDKSIETPLRIAEAVSFIEKNFTEDITPKEIALKANVSPRHFRRIFRETYNTTPVKRILQLRLQNACSLMARKEMNVTSIAFESGFSDSNYFSKQFKKNVGVSPLEYRKQLLNN